MGQKVIKNKIAFIFIHIEYDDKFRKSFIFLEYFFTLIYEAFLLLSFAFASIDLTNQHEEKK